ncbi:hypothetical protein SDC9_109075 [bioreactor metagenome]|uniref:Uncharacterized protein n=1 Tax=bioreactor metagenome TaxID=1076179 RepID=A0A645B9Q4_9ZZZZ
MAYGPIDLRAYVIEYPLFNPAASVGINRGVTLKPICGRTIRIVFCVAPDAGGGDSELAVWVNLFYSRIDFPYKLCGVGPAPVGKTQGSAVFCIACGVVKGCGITRAVFGHRGGRVEVVVKVNASHIVIFQKLFDAFDDQLPGLRVAWIEIEFTIVVGDGHGGVFPYRVSLRQRRNTVVWRVC